jgi:hypothetical protein
MKQKYLIYGSTAIKYHFPDYEREPLDLDIITETDNKFTIEIRDLKRIEQYYLPEFKYIFDNNKDDLYVDPDFLYTIKMSHLSWDINWDKHMKAAIYLQEQGCKLDKVLYNSLIKAWGRIHGKKSVKMGVKNSDFFKENIYRKFNHEYLHEQFAFYDRPLNERIRKDLDSPLCSEDLWNLLSEEDKIKCALEEIYVLSAERYIFVQDGERPWKLEHAVVRTLKNMITSTTSGWFNLFLKENFNILRTARPEHIIKKIEELKSLKDLEVVDTKDFLDNFKK